MNPNITPTFTAVNPICSGQTLSALPTTSNNGITGTWSPALNNTATTEYTFTPSVGQCATITTLTITVNPNITPTFTAVNPICSGQTLSALPTTSNNGITGTWSPALNNTATTEYTFTPSVGQCATITTLTITVNTTPTPTGDNIQSFSVDNLNDVTLANLVVQPSNVIWYGTLLDALSGTNPLSLGTILENGENYFAVLVVNGCPSEPFEVSVNVTLGVNTFEEVALVAYPSPTRGLVYLNSKIDMINVSVFATTGQILTKQVVNATNHVVDLSGFENGIYYLRLEFKNGGKTIKIIKN